MQSPIATGLLDLTPTTFHMPVKLHHMHYHRKSVRPVRTAIPLALERFYVIGSTQQCKDKRQRLKNYDVRTWLRLRSEYVARSYAQLRGALQGGTVRLRWFW